MTGYTKLFSSILMSSIWEESMETRLVWVTMLALVDQYGHVDGTVKSLARVSRVTIAQCQHALDCLLGPDELDRSGVMDGRRLIPEPGGWRLTNYATYRNKLSAEDRRERDRIRKRNARMSAPRPQMSANVREVQQAEAEADTEAEATTTKSEKASPLVVSPLRYEKLRQTHAFVGSRLRVPNVLHEELRTKCGRDGEPKLQGWYLILNEQLETSGDAMPDVFAWLRPRFVAWCESEGLVKAAPVSKGKNQTPPLAQQTQSWLAEHGAELQQAMDTRRRRAEMTAQGMDPRAIEAVFEAEYQARVAARR